MRIGLLEPSQRRFCGSAVQRPQTKYLAWQRSAGAPKPTRYGHGMALLSGAELAAWRHGPGMQHIAAWRPSPSHQGRTAGAGSRARRSARSAKVQPQSTLVAWKIIICAL